MRIFIRPPARKLRLKEVEKKPMPSESVKHSAACREVFALLSEYLEAELPADVRKQIESHLSGCGPCIDFAESLRHTIELCREYGVSDLPEALSEQARRQLRDAYQKMLASRTRFQT